MSRYFGCWVAIIVIVACGAAVSASADEAGIAAAVNPNATRTPPLGTMRVLDVGANLVINELVETTATGQTQLLFRDGSTLTIGPNANVTIDNFIYDPGTRTAKLAVNVAGGLMRVIGGGASKDGEGIQVKTPVATVGIRGGIAEIGFNPDTGSGFGRLLYGDTLTVTTGQGQ